jgi:hypothetical protein
MENWKKHMFDCTLRFPPGVEVYREKYVEDSGDNSFNRNNIGDNTRNTSKGYLNDDLPISPSKCHMNDHSEKIFFNHSSFDGPFVSDDNNSLNHGERRDEDNEEKKKRSKEMYNGKIHSENNYNENNNNSLSVFSSFSSFSSSSSSLSSSSLLSLSIFEVDGSEQKTYCQNLCLLGRLFIHHKTSCFDPSPFLFYILCEVYEYGCKIVGYFSKQKCSQAIWNLNCIVIFPPFQNRGYGFLLVDLCYKISKLNDHIGSPEPC